MAGPRRRFHLLLAVLLIAAALLPRPPSAAASLATAGKVSLELYYESLCPYCSRFIVNRLAGIFENGLIDAVDLRLVPYGNAHVRSNSEISCQIPIQKETIVKDRHIDNVSKEAANARSRFICAGPDRHLLRGRRRPDRHLLPGRRRPDRHLLPDRRLPDHTLVYVRPGRYSSALISWEEKMAPTLRREGEAAPVYGPDDDLFSVEVHHGDMFVGQGVNRAYIDEKVNFFYQCDTDTWSPLWIGDFVGQLGYQESQKLKVYWLLPGKSLGDGLRIICSDHDTLVMASVVKKVQNLVLYMDHDDNIAGMNWDDIVPNPNATLPKVDEKFPSFNSNVRVEASGQGDSDEDSVDSDFVDSDYELQEEDDDLFVDNVDEEVVDEGVAKGKKISNTMLSQLEVEASQNNRFQVQHEPLPDSLFIMSNQPTARPVPPTTATKVGKSMMNKRKPGTDQGKKPKKTKKLSQI